MSSAGVISGLTPWALLGVKGAGLGRRGGVDGAAPFMAAGAATAFGVKTGSSLAAVLGCRTGAGYLPLALWGWGLCKNHVWPAARAFGRL